MTAYLKVFAIILGMGLAIFCSAGLTVGGVIAATMNHNAWWLLLSGGGFGLFAAFFALLLVVELP